MSVKLILAQGNPGPEYAKTRHNIGWQVLDAYVREHNLEDFQSKSKFLSDILEYTRDGKKIILVKPTTFYNETGRAAQAIADFYQIEPENILVIHDDLALNFSTLRIRQGGSDGGNNGIRSLNAHLGPDFWRLRIGIKNDLLERIDSADFVLSRFSIEETPQITTNLIPTTSTIIDAFVAGTIEQTSLKTQ